VCAILALSYEFFSSSDADASQARNLMATGVLLLWLQQLRILYAVPAIGPLVFLIFEMWKDVFKWFVLQFFFVFSFGVGLYALFYNNDEDHKTLEECGLALTPDMRWLSNFANSSKVDQGLITTMLDWLQFDAVAKFHDASQGLFYLVPLLGTSINGDAEKFNCMRSTSHSLVGPIFMLLFLISTIVLLNNMLIAMMNDRFQAKYKHLQKLARFRLANRTTTSKYDHHWDPPSPLNLFFVIGQAVDFFCQSQDDESLELGKELSAGTKRQLEAAKRWYSQMETSELAPSLDQLKAMAAQATKAHGETDPLSMSLQMAWSLMQKKEEVMQRDATKGAPKDGYSA